MLWFAQVLISNEELSGHLHGRIWKLLAVLRECSLQVYFVPRVKGSVNLRERKIERKLDRGPGMWDLESPGC